MFQRRRRLRRHAKDLVCMRQIATCAYCGRLLCDAFEVDHVNECRFDDREENLVATCALCHAVKTRHVRLGRNWSAMRQEVDKHLHKAQDRWRSGASFDDLPEWLKRRVSRAEVRLHVLRVRNPESFAFQLDLDQFRFRAER